MSKIGKKTIQVPPEVTVNIEGWIVKVHGPKGSLELDTKGHVNIVLENNQVVVSPKNDKEAHYHGLYRTLINNLVVGVTQGFTKKLELIGIGYKASVQGGDLILNVGYSHPVTVKKVEGVEFFVNEGLIVVSGIDNVLVGDVAARIRAIRPPEPYKGKGIRYQGEYIIRKQAKAATA